MTRTRAWTISIIATATLLAIVLGIGASTGQFGFNQGGTTVGAQAVTSGYSIVNERASAEGFDEEERGREGNEEHATAGDSHSSGRYVGRQDW
jgi:hypothetical protein